MIILINIYLFLSIEMRYEPYFVILVFICVITGFIFSTINNDLDPSIYDNKFIEQNTNNGKDIKLFNITNEKKENINKKADEIFKEIKKKEKELKEKDEERKKKVKEEIEKLLEEEKIKKEEERKKKEEERKKKEEERKKKEEEERKRKEEERIKKEEEKKIKEKNQKEKEKEKGKNMDENIINKINENDSGNENKKGKLRIACAYATDNAYVYPTLVAMTSLAENAGEYSFYDIYVMISKDFTEENKKVLKSVEEKHPKHCEVIFLDMGDKFKDEKTNKKITTPAYYRLELHNLLPNVDRIIWMDGDTAVFEDLTELITLDMKGNYIMGFLDSIPEAIERFNISNATVLCSGVLLMDLDALRKNNMTEKFTKFMVEQKDKINQHDQTIINVVCQGKTNTLPPKYGIWSFEAEKYALKHNDRQRPHLRYKKDEFVKAYYHPAILHYVWPKPFWKKKKPVFDKEWWDYARISGYYNEVFNKSPKWVARLLMEKLEYSRYQYFY